MDRYFHPQQCRNVPFGGTFPSDWGTFGSGWKIFGTKSTKNCGASRQLGKYFDNAQWSGLRVVVGDLGCTNHPLFL